MAMPVKVLPAAEVTGMAKTFRYLVEDYEPDILVSGRPLTMAGEPGPQAERVSAVAQKIADELDLPLEFEDERLSSQEAKRILRGLGDVYKRQVRPNSLLLVRPSTRLLVCLSNPLLARRNPPVVRVLNSKRLLSVRRPLNLMAILTGSTARIAWLRLRVQATTPMLAAAPKRRTPRCP